ncbi:MAG: aspartyl protease family protein [Candidatus Binatia bacterium]
MGHVYVEATIRAKRKLKARFLVDTGATCSVISPDLAKKVGMEPSRLREKVHLANGNSVRAPTALGQIRIDGRETVTVFWIGECDEPLLGVEALEALGLAVDPRTGTLKATRPYATRLGGFGKR